ncbi:MAG: YwbE family protein [Crocinitomix sp.]|nr:YwbE family protein [Crocinitomix sp.]
MNGQTRKNVKIGDFVSIVLKEDQGSGTLTEGTVKRILTNSPTHPHGIKVMLDTGEVGRVKIIHQEEN